jgi:hypothetical protein
MAIVDAFCEGFKQKCQEFCMRRELFGDVEMSPGDCGELESMLREGVSAGGVKAMREYVESCEAAVPAIRVDGELMRFKAYESKEFHVGFGVVSIRRRLYQAAGGGSCVSPLDMKFNVVDEFAFPSVRRGVLHEAALMTPAEISGTMADWHVPPLSETAIKRMISVAGARQELLRPELEEATSLAKRLPEKPLALVASMDGTSTPVRVGREGRKYQVQFKMSMAGAVGVYGGLHVDGAGRLKMERLASTGFARMPEEGFPTFKASFDSELASVSEALPPDIPRILLCDAAPSLWNHARRTPLYKDFKWLVDYYHMSEHLSTSAAAIFGEGSKQGHAWMEKWKEALLSEEKSAKGIARSIEYYARTRRIPAARREALAAQATYFRNNHRLMNYAWFVKRGLPIGSGPVESCCKVLIKGRLCQSGMSWSEAGGQAILTLRAHRKYGDWNTFWTAYDNSQKESMPTLEEAAA